MAGKITFSPDQQAIINSRNENVLVCAAAGSGKTAVLVERIINRVLDKNNPVDIDELLVVTYTNAAATEMRERVEAAIEQCVANNPTDDHLVRQLTLIHNANITTIDSFCLNVVREHFHRIGLDPSFRIASEGERKLLMNDVLDEVIKKAYASKNGDFYNLVDCYSTKSDDGTIEDNVLKLFQFAESYPWPKAWLEQKKADYDFKDIDEFKNSNVIKEVFKIAEQKLNRGLHNLEKARDIILFEAGPENYGPFVEKDIETFTKLTEEVKKYDFSAFSALLMSLSKPRVTGRSTASDETKEAVKALRDSTWKDLNDLKEDYFMSTIDEYFELSNLAGSTVKSLIDLTINFMDEFAAQKRSKNIIDFSDMEHFAVEILIEDFKSVSNYTPSPVALEYRKTFKEVMVDEYQDANLVQEILLRSISHEDTNDVPNRFMVGDVKQSIYKFRMARPEIILGKQTDYKKAAKAGDRLIVLKENYRSRASVIDSVNAVFSKLMVEEYSKVIYDDDAKLYTASKDYGISDDGRYRTEVMLTQVGKLSSEMARVREAQAIADRITEIINSKLLIYDKKLKAEREITYKDIAIIFRAPSNWNKIMPEALNKAGIPCHMNTSGAFYEAPEIQEAISFLRVLDNPLADIPLYATLTSFFGKFTDEECAKLKAEAGPTDYYLWDKLVSYASKHPLEEKYTKFINTVNRFRELTATVAIHELIKLLFEETGYRNYCLARIDGKQRAANVDALIGKAKAFASSSFYGLFHFLRFIELCMKVEAEEGEAAVINEGANQVEIMSVHASKGLEFPVCFVAGLSGRRNLSDATKAFIMDVDKGIGAKAINPVTRVRKTTLQRSLVGERIQSEILEEDIRVLYVALTRAREKLIISGTVTDSEKWLAESGVKTGNYLDMIRPSINNGKLFEINIVDGEAVLSETSVNRTVSTAGKITDINSASVDEALLQKLTERLVFNYKYDNLKNLYTKTTVSEIKMKALEEVNEETHRMFTENETREYVPDFIETKDNVKGTDRGTAYHKVLSLINFSDDELFVTSDESRINTAFHTQMTDLVNKEKITGDILKLVNERKIYAFLKTEIARRMHEASKRNELKVEQPFMIGVKANELDASFPEGETVLVQGVIDVLFFEEGKAVILDYKTDRVETGKELVDCYRMQLEYYGKAIKQMTGIKDISKILYSFGLDGTFVVD